jgi:hypothetical protein
MPNTPLTDSFHNLLTLSGQILLLLGAVLAAVLGAGGGLRYFLEPLLKRRRLRKVMATGLWLSCYELRRHMEAINKVLTESTPMADEMRDALLKIPKNDFGGRPDWFVKTGYFSMITAYKIAVFSSWMRIYQMSVLQALLTVTWSGFISELFEKFDAFKFAASQNTVLWYNYIDAIGERLISTTGEISNPLSFSEFCKNYNDNPEFRFFFDQLHMFLHFVGRKEGPRSREHGRALSEMVKALHDIEKFIARRRENLLGKFEPKDRNRATSAELAAELSKYA